MSKLGEYLRTEREKKGLTIHEIGLSLKISSKILKAIEDGNTKDLPAKTFLRGFVKSYAQYLKIDQKLVLDLFQEEYGSTRPEPPQQKTPATEANASQPIKNDKSNNNIQVEKIAKKNEDLAIANQGSQKHYTLLIAGILLVLIAFVAKLMDKYQKESNTTSQNELVESLSATTTTVPTNTVASAESEDSTAATISEKAATPADTAEAAVTPTTAVTTTTVAVLTTTTTLKPVATTTTTTSTTTTTKPPVTTTTTTTSTTTTTVNKAAITEVIVEALNQVKVRFSLNGGQKWESIDLSADQVHTFRTRGNVDLEISDGGAVNIIVNGRERGVPGTIGKPIKLVYPK